MSIPLKTSDQLVAEALAAFRVRFASRDLSTESFLGKLSRSEAIEILGLMQAIQFADYDAVPTSNTSSAALDLWAIAVGVSNGAGGYGRKSATVAKGLTATVTGTNGTSFPDASILTASDGTTAFVLNNSGSALVISGSPPGTGSISGTFDATTGGTVGNLPVDSVLTWQSPPSGADTTVTTTVIATTLGIDSESDSDLLIRIQAKMQSPPKGGASADFRAWAESVSGVHRGYPYPLRGGLGTAHVVIAGSGSGRNRLPTALVQTAVNNYVTGNTLTSAGGQRSVTAQGFSTLLPTMPTYGTGSGGNGGLTIRCRMQAAKSKYAFDWVDTASTYTASAYSAGPPATVTLNAALPASLTAAVDAGNKPRIQILVTTTGGPSVPLQVGVTAYNSGTRVLTLDTLPDGWVAPTAGDTLYAGGPTVTQTAQAVVDYVDSLGPSRSGGYAEAVADFWEDTCAIDRVKQIVLDQVDTDGSRFFKNTLTTTSVTIGNGSNAATTSDVTADNSGSTPEILWTRFAVITQ